MVLSSEAAIVDVECILAINNKYLIKELSVIDTTSWATQHWIFKHSGKTQNAKSRSVNRWLERHYHRLSLDYGDVEYDEIGRILNSLKFDRIYVKGEQKQKLISDFIPHVQVMNLEEWGCPQLDQLCSGDEAAILPLCIFHRDMNPKHCTFHKVFALRKWFNDLLRSDSFSKAGV